MTCIQCQDNRCEECVDRLLLLGGRNPICTCERRLHDDKVQGEARLKQVEDPTTGTIHGPAVQVTVEGDVTRG